MYENATIVEGGANVADAAGQGLVRGDAAAPDDLHQFILRDQAVGVLGEVPQKIEALGTQFHLAAVPKKAGALDVEGEVREL
jgi:hypothetical protein